MTPKPIVNTESLPEFFKDAVCHAVESLNVKISLDVEYYVVNLLTSFSHAEKLFERGEEGKVIDKALASRLYEATLVSPSSKISILKKLGDVALYTSGFFADSFIKKIIGLDYYIQMGHSAYSSISQLVPPDPGKMLKDLFQELASNFTCLVDVISQVAESSSLNTNKDLLNLYERWLTTGSERARELLSQEGIIPIEMIKSRFMQ